MIAIGRSSSPETSRTTLIRSAWSSCDPCEKLRRAASTPARASSSTRSRDDDAGPSVATIFVRRGSSADIGRRLARAHERGPAGIGRVAAELFLDPQELVVLRCPVAARRGARLDLADVGGDGEVRDRRVLGLALAV